MRNGNNRCIVIAWDISIRFLPYLWGMETNALRTLMTQLFFVLTVPMRNGNVKGKTYKIKSETLFLPYLWGMETWNAFTDTSTSTNSSYRTYEEWKPQTQLQTQEQYQSSYRTYEEWKHLQETMTEQLSKTLGSYRTYEEWKRCFNIKCSACKFKVLTVPMRNGN